MPNDNPLTFENVPSLCKLWGVVSVADIIANDFKASAENEQEYEINPIIYDELLRLASDNNEHLFLKNLLSKIVTDNVHNEKYHKPLLKLHQLTLEGTEDNTRLHENLHRSINDINKRIADSVPQHSEEPYVGRTQYHRSSNFM